MQHAGGGWAGDVDVIDALDLTTAQLIEEVFAKRVSTDEIILHKDAKGCAVFPVRSENWEQPIDGRSMMTKRIRKSKKITAIEGEEPEDGDDEAGDQVKESSGRKKPRSEQQ